MFRSLLALAPLCLLAGCAGYAADHWRPKAELAGPELARYGLDQRQQTCVNQRLTASLGTAQLARLGRTAALVTEGFFEPGRLTVRDLIYVAGRVDPETGRELAEAIQECGAAQPLVTTTAPSGAAPGPAPGDASQAPAAASAAAAPAGPVWLNLGAAPTGQSIAVDASQLEQEGSTRIAWFRLTNPGAAVSTGIAYNLRIDCAARTITPLAERRPGENGATEFREYEEGDRRSLPIEGGTVMEIAYLALCT
jgi:hypothetical protein